MKRIASIVVLAAGVSAAASDAASPACRAQSGEHVVPLVELYTSEGCDSCPAADRWLSARFPAGTQGDAVALAFHVDYWDRLGWKDRFAAPAFTQRQHQAMRANRSTFVYTPQVLLQGRDFRAWRSDASAPRADPTRKQRASVRIVAEATPDSDTVVVRADVTRARGSRGKAIVGFAYVDSGLVTQVKAGENRGARLVHDHVARAFETRALEAFAASYRVELRKPAEAGEHPRIVVFVQDADNGEVVQALGLPLAGCL